MESSLITSLNSPFLNETSFFLTFLGIFFIYVGIVISVLAYKHMLSDVEYKFVLYPGIVITLSIINIMALILLQLEGERALKLIQNSNSFTLMFALTSSLWLIGGFVMVVSAIHQIKNTKNTHKNSMGECS
jgi:amino acid transporter